MKNKSRISDRVSASVESAPSMVEKALFTSRWQWEHWRKGKLIDSWEEKNMCTNEGLEHALGVAFGAGTPVTDWFIAIYNSNTTPASNMVYATPLFTESTNYSETTRPEWVDAGVSSKVITNTASKASFTMSLAEVVYGAGLVGGGSAATTKGDAAGGGVLYNVSAFSGGSKSVASDDVLKVTVALTIADA
jgi:hypothetical protein